MMREAHLQKACCELVADVARISGKVQLKVAGASMAPTLWPGDLVFVRHCDPAQLHPNAVIVFRQEQRLIIHRFMHWAGQSVIARGDARPCFDDPVSVDDIVGEVESVVRDGRTVSTRLSLWNSMIAALMRRSEWWARFYMRLRSKIRSVGFAEAILGA
ncbi:MAG: S26 family signal peptidase [Terracidiphilus sp.]